MIAGLPDPTQQLLLHAALDDGPSALRAFEAWQGHVDLNGHVELGSFRLLPLVHENLRQLQCDDPLMGRLGGIYRYHWCEMQRLLRPSLDAARKLAAAGVPVMASKGLALALDFYASPALRPMSDADIMVPVDRVRDAIEVIEGSGWRQIGPGHAPGRLDHEIALRHAMTFENADGAQLDLHWRVAWEIGSARATREVWRAGVPIQSDPGAPLRCSSTHLVLQAILHGVLPNAVAPIRWVADVVTVARRDPHAIDWDALIAFGTRERVLSRLASALLYLEREFAFMLETRIVRALEGYRPGAIERIETHLMAKPLGSGAFLDAGRLGRGLRLIVEGRSAALPRAIARATRNTLARGFAR